jgi:hypothetical protein
MESRASTWCVFTPKFNLNGALATLAGHGITKSESNGAMKVRVRIRGADNGGASEGTPEMYIGDPDGLIVQMQDASYCGGAGVLGNSCLAEPESAPSKGLLALEDLSHVTLLTTNVQRSLDFYQSVFAMRIQGRQGHFPARGGIERRVSGDRRWPRKGRCATFRGQYQSHQLPHA